MGCIIKTNKPLAIFLVVAFIVSACENQVGRYDRSGFNTTTSSVSKYKTLKEEKYSDNQLDGSTELILEKSSFEDNSYVLGLINKQSHLAELNNLFSSGDHYYISGDDVLQITTLGEIKTGKLATKILEFNLANIKDVLRQSVLSTTNIEVISKSSQYDLNLLGSVDFNGIVYLLSYNGNMYKWVAGEVKLIHSNVLSFTILKDKLYYMTNNGSNLIINTLSFNKLQTKSADAGSIIITPHKNTDSNSFVSKLESESDNLKILLYYHSPDLLDEDGLPLNGFIYEGYQYNVKDNKLNELVGSGTTFMGSKYVNSGEPPREFTDFLYNYAIQNSIESQISSNKVETKENLVFYGVAIGIASLMIVSTLGFAANYLISKSKYNFSLGEYNKENSRMTEYRNIINQNNEILEKDYDQNINELKVRMSSLETKIKELSKLSDEDMGKLGYIKEMKEELEKLKYNAENSINKLSIVYTDKENIMFVPKDIGGSELFKELKNKDKRVKIIELTLNVGEIKNREEIYSALHGEEKLKQFKDEANKKAVIYQEKELRDIKDSFANEIQRLNLEVNNKINLDGVKDKPEKPIFETISNKGYLKFNEIVDVATKEKDLAISDISIVFQKLKGKGTLGKIGLVEYSDKIKDTMLVMMYRRNSKNKVLNFKHGTGRENINAGKLEFIEYSPNELAKQLVGEGQPENLIVDLKDVFMSIEMVIPEQMDYLADIGKTLASRGLFKNVSVKSDYVKLVEYVLRDAWYDLSRNYNLAEASILMNPKEDRLKKIYELTTEMKNINTTEWLKLKEEQEYNRLLKSATDIHYSKMKDGIKPYFDEINLLLQKLEKMNFLQISVIKMEGEYENMNKINDEYIKNKTELEKNRLKIIDQVKSLENEYKRKLDYRTYDITDLNKLRQILETAEINKSAAMDKFKIMGYVATGVVGLELAVMIPVCSAGLCDIARVNESSPVESSVYLINGNVGTSVLANSYAAKYYIMTNETCAGYVEYLKKMGIENVPDNVMVTDSYTNKEVPAALFDFNGNSCGKLDNIIYKLDYQDR